MNKERLDKFVGTSNISVVEAMGKIDVNACGVLFIVNESNELAGCITDGDIRRWFLRGGKLNAPAKKAMSVKPCFLYEEDILSADFLLSEKKITAVPILDKSKAIVDVILSKELAKRTHFNSETDMSDVPVIVMAGGRGTRLYPYTKILPKPLIPIGETPIIERILDYFCGYGISKFFMTVNYKKSMIKSYFADLCPEYEINYVEETKPLGTGGGIKLIQEKFTKPVIVTNCDALVLADYDDLYRHHALSGNAITMVTALKNITVPYGVVKYGKDGQILSMEEKPKLSYFINTGMYVINPDTIDLIPEDEMYHMTNLVSDVMKNGGKVGTYPISEDSFLDMGEFSEMKRMEEKLQIASENI